ncbi:ComEC/Rec2 family competence protein [Streptomyces sp. NPDC018045]|uniref:ComEC/Rec2 family competence protein n=1 Tax=Streptomyces sp. NPDC018045 TaxID=3365037 RepID=UPI0037ACDB69
MTPSPATPQPPPHLTNPSSPHSPPHTAPHAAPHTAPGAITAPADTSGAATLDSAVPDAATPDSTVPGITPLGITTSDTATPNTAVPDTATSDLATSHTTTGRSPLHAAASSPYGSADPRRPDEAVDLRLVGPASAAWGAAALALGWSGGSVAAAGAGAAALAAIVVVVAVRRPERRTAGALIALAAVLLGAVAGAASAALHAADVRRGPLPELARRHAQVTAEVELTGDPRLTRPRVSGARQAPPAVVFTAEALRVAARDGTVTATRTPVLVVVHRTKHLVDWQRLLPSTRVRLTARAAPPLQSADRAAAALRVTTGPGPQVVGTPDALQRLAGDLRAGLREASDGLSPDARALLPGLVVGDTARVPPDLDDAFRTTDLTHLLAVSGSNLTILLVLLIGPPHLAVRAERRGLAPILGLSLRATALVGGSIALAFVIVCRPDPSVLRAAACGLITLLAIGTGRRRSLVPALAAAVLVLVLYDPWLARSYGFLLSVLATGALLTLAPRWSAALQRRRVPPRLAEVLAAAAAAQAVCAPVVVVLAARVGLVAIPCNLLAEPAVAPATVLGFAALATAPFAPPLAHALAWCASWPTEWIAGVARTGAGLPGAELDWPGGWAGALLLAVVTVAFVLVGRRLLRRPWLCVLGVLTLLVAILRPVPVTRVITGWPPQGWRAVACDVGQGDGLVIAAGEGTALVVDTGPEPDAIDRCLTDLGVRRIPLLVLTHFHADHVSGLPGVLRGRSVGAIETTTLPEPPGQAAFVHRTAAAAGVPVTGSTPGERRSLGPLTWQVLWPPAADPGHPFSAPASRAVEGPNDASVTLLLRTFGLTFLLLGDLEPISQQALSSALPDLPAVDVLKVAHHGSAYQDPRLIRRLAPRVALISCGAGNPYGHPAPRTVQTLRSQGARVLRTDTDGAIAVLGGRDRLTTTVRGGRRSPARPPGRRRARAGSCTGCSTPCRSP